MDNPTSWRRPLTVKANTFLPRRPGSTSPPEPCSPEGDPDRGKA